MFMSLSKYDTFLSLLAFYADSGMGQGFSSVVLSACRQAQHYKFDPDTEKKFIEQFDFL